MFEIEDDDKYKWTNHVKEKMAYYRLSPSIVKRVIRFPNRTEEGIAPKTVAVMQSKNTISRAKGKEGKKTEEIWVMFQQSQGLRQKPRNKLEEYINANQPKKTIISAWRYPGVSQKGKKIEIPEDTMIALENENFE